MLRNLKEFKLPEIEEKVLKFWKENQIFEKSLKLREGGKKYRFFEGPPTANGRPGIHHVESRAFKDVIPRFKTMCGYFVRRKAGWDTQGLPVEIEVEKELGLKNKQEIEKFGIAGFNEKAKASVWKYLDDWEKLTDRIGFWLNLKEAYITYKPQYIESLWWVFKQIADKGLLKQSFKIIPFCPRCQTPLSSHEMGQPGVYKKVKDPSVYVKFEIKEPKSSKLKAKSYLLVWTTTPWTLPSNVAIAVNPNLSYTKYKIGDEFIWSYNVPPTDIANFDKIEVVEKVSGKKLIGTKYKPLFNVKGPWLKNKKFFQVYGADFVGTEDGTGLVHIAPAFGEDDMNLIKKFQKDLVGEIPITIDERGIVHGGLPGAGKFAKQADKEIIDFLVKTGPMLKCGEIEHEYPFCWRCSTPILYYARFSWFIEMSSLSSELLKNNEKVNWIPEYIKEGRFGNWLKEVKDWAISRDRYWGTPLPIWKCEKCGGIEVAGGLADLDKKRYSKNNFFLLRHGEADHVIKDLVASGPEIGKNISHLTEKGISQVKKSSEKLIKILRGGKLSAIYVSPYTRTVESAKIIAKKNKLKVIIDKRLSEINAGIFNWKKISDYGSFWSNHLDKFTKAPPEGENLTDLKKRMMEAILDINSKHEDENILIVSHGDPLWILEGAVSGLNNEEMLKAKYMEVGEIKELDLHNWPYNSNAEIDMHRPYVDNIYLGCKKCKTKMKRVSEVADCWFDSGAMPFAQDHFPFSCREDTKSSKLTAKSLENCTDFPADYISEAIDQTRGWFYTLLAISTALGLDVPPYKNVICLGMVLDKKGQKMSKSKGNVVSPWDMINKYGADIIRWYFYTINQPADPKQFDEADLGKMLRKFIMIIYNSFVFFDTYALKTKSSNLKAQSSNILDKWILSKLCKVTNTVTEDLEKYDVVGAGKILEEFVDDLSRWYIRRSRTRLQRSEDKKDFEAASQTLYNCLLQLSKLLAPFTPFFADALFMSLNNESGIMNDGEKKSRDSKFIIRNSVHLQDWPDSKKSEVDFQLLEKMDEIRKISSLALALRAEKGLKVRQPLGFLEIKSKKIDRSDSELLDILKDEVNVKEVRWNFEMQDDISLDTEITSELREEGIIREAMRMVQGLRHDANYVPKDTIMLLLDVSDPIRGILDRRSAELKKAVGARDIEFGKSDKFDAEINSKIDNEPIWVAVRKL